MTMVAPQLTKDRQVLAAIIDRHADREEQKLLARRTMWSLAWLYLNGYRRFDRFNPLTGEIRPFFLDENGDMEFQSQELLSALDRFQAKLNSMNMAPLVRGTDSSLERIRERAINQIALDAVVKQDQLKFDTQRKFNFMYAAYGSAGIIGHLTDHPIVGLTSDMEAVHPREVFPFPTLGQDHTKATGKVRQRLVPLDFLVDVFGTSVRRHKEEMLAYESDPADLTALESDLYNPLRMVYHGLDGSAPAGAQAKENSTFVKVRELWMDGPAGLCSRYTISSGKYIIEDNDLRNKEAFCPLGWARCLESGTFHGLGIFDLLYGINRQLEFLLKQLFNNIRDTDQYGVVVLPQGSFNEKQMLKQGGKGFKVLPLSYDPMLDNFRPFAVQPVNSGDVPGRVAQLAKNLMSGINPVQDLAAEKGRVDSFSGLQFLDEQLNRGLTNPTTSVEAAYGAAYRSIVSRVGEKMQTSPRPLPVSRITTDLAGAVIDPTKNEVHFSENPIPSTRYLTYSIKETSPSSKVSRKSEAITLLENGVTDPEAFAIFALEEGLDFAFWSRDKQAAYETVVRNCVLAYGDGKTPGRIIVNEYQAVPTLQIRVLMAFMAHPRTAMASPEVQDTLADYLDFLKQQAGIAQLQSAPNPDDVAMMTMGLNGEAPAPEGMMQ